MPTKQLKTNTEIEDFVRGATYFGTGGGGSAENGNEVLKDLLAKGVKTGWVDSSEIEDSLYSASPFGMGSIAPKGDDVLQAQKAYGCTEIKIPRGKDFARAIDELEKEVHNKIDVLVPIELGGGNSATCMAAAAISGRLVVDGDYTGRAIPEIFQTTPYIHEMELMPLTSCDSWGNISIVREAINWRMAERIGKFLSVAAFTGCAMSGFAMEAAQMKKALVHGSLTECYQLGKTIREARENSADPVRAATDLLGGWVLLRGKVTKKEWWDKDGYFFGWHTFSDNENNEMRVFFKNENHLCYKNDTILVTSPDMIIVVNNETGEPMTNTVIKEGMDVAVVAVKSREIARSLRGLEALGPQNFGENAPYIPVEKRMATY